MADDYSEYDEAGNLLTDAVRIMGSIIVPLADAWPSSAISYSYWNPAAMNATFHFHNGGTADHSCSPAAWYEYKMTPSRGKAYNDLFRGK